MQSAYTVPAEFAEEETQFKYHVLARSRHQLRMISASDPTHVIGSQQDNSEHHFRVINEFLDDCAAFVGLFVKDDRFKPQSFEEPRNRFTDSFVVAVNNEYL